MIHNNQRAERSKMNTNAGYIGETIECKMRRILNNGEPISDGAPLIYTERKDGVQPSYNIRTDRWDAALEAMTTVSKAHTAKREERAKAQEQIIKDIEGGTQKDGGTEPIQAKP